MIEYLEIVTILRNFIWNGPTLFLLVITGLFLSFKLRFVQLRFLGHGFRTLFSLGVDKKDGQGDLSSFQAIMTAMAGAIGTGNITGIATAVIVGGYGAIFWMWVVAFFGMATAYSETILGHHFRTFNDENEVCGGPMYTLSRGLGYKKLAIFFAICGSISAFGYAMVQSNSVVDAIVTIDPELSRLVVGGVVMFATAIVVLGGIKVLGRVAAVLVPFMAFLYLIMGALILVSNFEMIPQAFKMIFIQAFTSEAAIGGAMGGGLLLAVQTGAQYGIFANEAGLGSYAISGASSRANPVEQGILSMTGVFIATMLVCTMTGLVLAVTSDLVPKGLIGSPLAMASFSSFHSSFRYVLLVGLILFAFTTILAWQYYGEKCTDFFLGQRVSVAYRIIFLGVVLLGAVLELDAVWTTAHLANGLMVIPNTISILLLASIVKQKTEEF
ncbi:MAG: sodium:alanine symporter family protein [Francisellaceae bacterium]|jgi:alanine or glycine:cation symporter, AGCS family|nr:sodium:alanine symporter family protein [Francisellaceae bacterium]MBT6206535.1 sodium:alanine symporter family protein [Francisellaceae bacterium]MBT6538802.1 sodium:alanine symporter family protein [Francisellaceae bacterium]